MSRTRRRRIVSAAPVLSTIPRTLYPFVPPEMRLALRCTLQTAVALDPAAGALHEVPLAVPVLPGNNFPEYFRALMTIYSRCRVDKVSVIIRIQNLGVVPVHWAFGISSAIDGAAIAGAGDQIQRIRMLPNSKFGMLGSISGGHDQQTVTMLHDNLKAIGPGLYSDNYATTSSAAQPPVIAIPNFANMPDAPWGYISFLNSTGDNNGTLTFVREVIYHVTLSSKHAVNPAA